MLAIVNTASSVKFLIAQESMQPSTHDYFVFLFLAPMHTHTNQLQSVLRFEVSTAVKIWITVFWVMTLCSLVHSYQ
jgi:hypothetical protein